MTEGRCIAVLGERIIDLVPGDRPGAFVALPGGSPANVALALARLGVQPLLLGRRAGDAFALALDAHLSASGLGLEGLVDAGGVSMLAVCTPDEHGSMSYAFYTADSPDLRWTIADVTAAEALMADRHAIAWHTGSLVSYLGSGTEPLLESWQRARAEDRMTLTYDPNARPHALDAASTRTWVEAFAMAAHVVKASEEDLAYCYPEATPEQVCARWAASGPVLVVLTRGGRGATYWRRGEDPVDVPAPEVPVVDTVAAGDTLMGALLAALSPWFGPSSAQSLLGIEDDVLADSVLRAVSAAALTCTRAGAQPPSLSEVEEFLAGRVTG